MHWLSTILNLHLYCLVTCLGMILGRICWQSAGFSRKYGAELCRFNIHGRSLIQEAFANLKRDYSIRSQVDFRTNVSSWCSRHLMMVHVSMVSVFWKRMSEGTNGAEFISMTNNMISAEIGLLQLSGPLHLNAMSFFILRNSEIVEVVPTSVWWGLKSRYRLIYRARSAKYLNVLSPRSFYQ